ncbi:hypothetical protein VTK26DRAFT_898 [Humicola hyalothermophila]
MKVYIPAIPKAITSGRSCSDFVLDAVRNFQPLGAEIGPGLDVVSDASTIKGARVKVHLHTSSNSFAVARDVMTLGGRLADEKALKRIELLRSIWPLLRNERPGDGPDPDLDEANAGKYDAWSKPERIVSTAFSGLQHNVELSPGKTGLETECYVPLFQHHENDQEAEASMEKVLKKLGREWGSSGKYRETVKTVFGKDQVSPTFVSFSYSKKKGAHLSAYILKMIEKDS